MFMVALSISHKKLERPKYASVGEWLNKLGHPQNGTLLSENKEWYTQQCAKTLGNYA